MRLTIGLLLIVSAAVFAQAPPENVLVWYDNYGGYGNAVLTAIGNLWPAANVQSYTNNATGFNAALNNLGDGWDIIVIEAWYYNPGSLYYGGVKDLYDTSAARVFFSSWQMMGNSFFLANAMGVTSTSSVSGGVIPHYAWEAGHAICEGIGDWGWNDPGLGVLNNRLTVSSATPVTGWTSSPGAGQAGICVANDGRSVISGFTPAYANEAVDIWENILDFMWPTTSLTRTSWGEIKASF